MSTLILILKCININILSLQSVTKYSFINDILSGKTECFRYRYFIRYYMYMYLCLPTKQSVGLALSQDVKETVSGKYTEPV